MAYARSGGGFLRLAKRAFYRGVPKDLFFVTMTPTASKCPHSHLKALRVLPRWCLYTTSRHKDKHLVSMLQSLGRSSCSVLNQGRAILAGKCAPETANLESDQSLPTELAKHNPLSRPKRSGGWSLHRLISANSRKYFRIIQRGWGSKSCYATMTPHGLKIVPTAS